MTYGQVTSFTCLHVESLQHQVNVPRLGQAQHPLTSIPIDAKYIGCLTQVFFMKIFVISILLIECNIGTIFPIYYISSTHIIQKLVGVPLIFLHIHMVHLYLIKSNIMTISSKIEVSSSQYLSEFINTFALPLETTSLDKMWQ